MREEALTRRATLRPEHRVQRDSGRFHQLLALAVLLAPLPQAEAFPIAPQTLWELTQKATLVVWADIEGVEPLPPNPSGEKTVDLNAGDVARLRVREVWKGATRPGELVEVHFNSGLVCPAPPRYEPGLAVVAFLTLEGGRWRTVSLSYGTRYPTSHSEADAYREAVTRAHAIQEQWTQVRASGRTADDMAAARTSWQVLAAAHPATRWDGMYGLEPESDEDHFFYDLRRPRSAPLSPAQREQLAKGFVEHPPLDRALPMMLATLRGQASVEVDRAAANALETLLAEEDPPHWAALAFALLRERHGEKLKQRSAPKEDPQLRTFTDASGAPKGSTPRSTHPLVQEWRAFKQRHHLEPKRLALPVEPPVPGTGGETTP
ncbi:hypothetical protein [Myxococcus sp. RHSTA-1-4]|uniref:hypothetical protein n=1 Tax=Myxococcus sp. RHSTA-1-4 TaxID=2874601 RepID=UPI001CBD3C7F|nr:hypothetical protein [Myxococcus sp. RHSTA-1-4]MBZ4419406.1 hypothetical protein [Myxococcus sp. RHSTA-1-4]